MNMVKKIFTYILALFTICVAYSCSENEEFTDNPSGRLTFSTDTLSFDTIFRTIPSTTKRLIVYNPNSKGVRISNVSIESSASNVFRMNVDGISGNSIDDVEIYGKDSIFIFVETTLNEEHSELIKPVNSKIVFTFANGMRQAVEIEASSMNATFMKHESITSDTIFDSNVPYVIYDSLVVEENATLTLTAGVSLYFHNAANLIVKGKLKVEGELGNEVIFRGDRTDWLLSGISYNMIDNTWGGIYLTPECQGCEINYADIHGGSYGVDCDSISGTLTIKNSIIHNVGGNALRINRTNAHIANTELNNSFGYCAMIVNSNSDFYHCTLAQFYPWHYDRRNSLLVVQNADKEYSNDGNPLFCNNFYNCLITGYADDEVFAEFNAEKAELGLHFYSSVLNTDTSDDNYFTDCVKIEFEKDDMFHTNRFLQRQDKLSPFMPDSANIALGKGNFMYCKDYPKDRLGEERTEGHVDAGCYQYVKSE